MASKLAEAMDDVVVGWDKDGKPVTAGKLTVVVFELVEEAVEAGVAVIREGTIHRA